MSGKTVIDPALVGIWLVPGQPETYEVTADGGFHIAEPEEALEFYQDGTMMIWGGRPYHRTEGAGESPVGTWRNAAASEAWDFTADQGFSLLSTGPTGTTAYTGIWALRDEGRALWTRELRAHLISANGKISFLGVAGESFTYAYTLERGLWRVLDPESQNELARYVSADLMVESAGPDG